MLTSVHASAGLIVSKIIPSSLMGLIMSFMTHIPIDRFQETRYINDSILRNTTEIVISIPVLIDAFNSRDPAYALGCIFMANLPDIIEVINEANGGKPIFFFTKSDWQNINVNEYNMLIEISSVYLAVTIPSLYGEKHDY